MIPLCALPAEALVFVAFIRVGQGGASRPALTDEERADRSQRPPTWASLHAAGSVGPLLDATAPLPGGLDRYLPSILAVSFTLRARREWSLFGNADSGYCDSRGLAAEILLAIAQVRCAPRRSVDCDRCVAPGGIS